MHSYALIPVLAILVAAAFGAAAIAWDSGPRSTLVMGSIFACTGAWAFFDLMTFVDPDPARAELWIRWMLLPILLLGPSVTWLLAGMFPQLRPRLIGLARAGCAAAIVLGIAVAVWPGSVEAVVRTAWGSMAPRYGVLPFVVMPMAVLLPLVATYEASRMETDRRSATVDASRVNAVRLVVFVAMLATFSTEFVMPLLERPVPRLGAVAVACASAAMWLRVRYVAEQLAISPDGLAQSMLDELHDGVVLVHDDGSIHAASKRFTSMLGSPPAELIGTSLESHVEVSLEEICGGLEEHKSILHRADGESLPVSLSSTIARDHLGEPVGAVVVFRDLREIDALQRRLLISGRLAAIGELAAGIAHEVNNPVAFVRSDLNLLSRRLEEIRDRTSGFREPAEDAIFTRTATRVEQALDGVERVAEVVGDVRSFAHVGGAGQGGSDPAVLVEGAMRLARLQRGDDVELRVLESECRSWIESGQELKQILLALMLVLVEGSDKGGLVEAALESDGAELRIVLTAGKLTDHSGAMIRRFERLSAGEFVTSHDDFGLTIAAELMDQLDASFSLVDVGSHAVSIELRLPQPSEAA